MRMVRATTGLAVVDDQADARLADSRRGRRLS